MQVGMKQEKAPWKLVVLWAATLAFWLLLYLPLKTVSETVTFEWLGLRHGERFGEALAYFLYDAPKILLLLVLMVYALGVIRSGLDTERIRRRIASVSRLVGYCVAALFGALTPFCSCSSIPLFLGFAAGGIPLGISMAFLVASPLINEVAVVVLWDMMGAGPTLVYVACGLTAAIACGFLMDAIGAQRWLQPYLLEIIGNAAGNAGDDALAPSLTLWQRHRISLTETGFIVRKVWLWVILGVTVGAFLHGFVPQDWFARTLPADAPWSVPVAVAAGIPLYTNVTGVVPVMHSLLLKGLPLGTVLAFCMSTVAVSLPELMMLRQVMTGRLLGIFVLYLLCAFVIIGWSVNILL